MNQHQNFLKQAVHLAMENKRKGGRPFGAVIVKDGEVVATGINDMLSSHDPSSHAELEAIRTAGKRLGKLTLEGCIVYASGHPCPMCLALILMTNVEQVFYAFDNSDGAPFGLSSELTYRRLDLSPESVALSLTKLDVGITASEVYS